MDIAWIGVVAWSLRRQTHDDRVLEDTPGIACLERVQVGGRTAGRREGRSEIHSAVVTERGDRLACARVDCRQVSACDVQQPAITPVGTVPVVHSTRADSAWMRARPDLRPGDRIERDEIVGSRQHERQAIGHQRIEEKRAIAGGKGPRHYQPRHVRRVDLIERSELCRVRAAKVAAPGGVGLRRTHRSRRRLGEDCRQCGRREPTPDTTCDDKRTHVSLHKPRKRASTSYTDVSSPERERKLKRFVVASRQPSDEP